MSERVTHINSHLGLGATAAARAAARPKPVAMPGAVPGSVQGAAPRSFRGAGPNSPGGPRLSIAPPRQPTVPRYAALASRTVRLLDKFALTFALLVMLLSYFIRHRDGTLVSFLSLRVSFRNILLELALLLVWRCIFWIMGLYEPRLLRGVGSILWRVPLTVLPCTGVLIPALLLRNADHELGRSCLIFWTAGSVFMLLVRAGVLCYERVLRPLLRTHRSVVICGTGPRAHDIALGLAAHPDFRYPAAWIHRLRPARRLPRSRSAARFRRAD